MKKALFTLALAAFAFAANAQIIVGGQINYNTTGSNTKINVVSTPAPALSEYTMPGDDVSNVNTSDLAILPKIGYQLDDKMQVGLSFGLLWTKSVDYSGYAAQYAAIADFEGWQRVTMTGISIAPYFRYNVMEWGKFTVFCEAQLAFAFSMNPKVHNYHSAYTLLGVNVPELDEDVEGFEINSTDINLTIVPGLNYKLSEKFSADLYIDLLGIGFSHSKTHTFIDYNVVAGTTGLPANTREENYSTNNFYLMANASAQTLNAHFGAFRLGFNYHF